MKLNVFKKYLILPFIILTSCSTQNQLIEIERNASLTEPISIDGTTLQEKINNKIKKLKDKEENKNYDI